MMKSTIALASRGRIIPSGYKRSIALATIGWILITSGPQPPQPVEETRYAVGGGMAPMNALTLKRLIQDDDELLAIIKIWVNGNDTML